jgi:CDGSH-type Zn-finger protein
MAMDDKSIPEPEPDGNRASGGGPESVPLPAGIHQLCRCGRSRQGWFCDGAHLGSGLVSYELRLEGPATVTLCGCGRSRRFPFCDGRHQRPASQPWWRFWRAGGA